MKLPKDKKITLRINSEVKALLEKNGHRLQKLFDEAIFKIVKVNRNLTIIEEERHENNEDN
jgi:hypothetical protein